MLKLLEPLLTMRTIRRVFSNILSSRHYTPFLYVQRLAITRGVSLVSNVCHFFQILLDLLGIYRYKRSSNQTQFIDCS